MNRNDLEIRRVTSRRDLARFIRLPWRIYQGDPCWVPPLIRDVALRLNRSRHPFFEHASMELFLACRGREVSGRIAAIVDERHNRFHHDRVGFFGMFECIDDLEAARALFRAAETWCGNRGMTRVRGPMNLSMNDECGFLLEGFDAPPVLMMTYTPKYYLDLCEGCDLVKSKDLHAYRKDDVGVLDRIAALVERVKTKERVRVRPIDMAHFDREVGLIKEIYNSAWELNWGFVPMTEKEMDLLASQLRPIVEPALVLFAEVDGNSVGVSITLPDYNQVLRHMNGRLGPLSLLKMLYYRRKITGLRAIVFGIRREFRRTGISTVLYYETEKAAERLGYQWCEMSWTLEDNAMINRFDEAVGGRLYKKYRIYEKDIPITAESHTV